MRNRSEVARTIDDILLVYADCIAWKDYGAAGSPCYDPYDFASPAEEEEAAYTLAAVQLEMGKYSKRHKNLAKKVAKETGSRYITYPWLRDAVSRVLAGSTYSDLLSIVRLSKAVKEGMKAKGLKEIHSISEALC